MYGRKGRKWSGRPWGFCLEKQGTRDQRLPILSDVWEGLFSSQLAARTVWRSLWDSLDKSLSLNTFALELKEMMLAPSRLSPAELSQSDSGILHVQP